MPGQRRRPWPKAGPALCRVLIVGMSIFGVYFTLAFQALSHDSPEQRPAVIAECGRHVVVDFEAMRNIDAKSLHLQLKKRQCYQTHFISNRGWQRKYMKHNYTFGNSKVVNQASTII